MDNSSYRSNRHVTQAQPAEQEAAPAPTVEERPAGRVVKHPRVAKTKRLPMSWLLAALAVVVLLLAGWFVLRPTGAAGSIDGDKVQAVFFTNGQVYFGKLHMVNDEYMKLTDIFYLQAKTATTKDSPQQTSGGSASDVQLIKLGQEIHGPEDAMVFNKSQILFFENLKKDGNVSSTIAKYQKK